MQMKVEDVIINIVSVITDTISDSKKAHRKVVLVHAMKAYRGSRILALLILNLSTWFGQ